MDGIIVINKEKGFTSFDVVAKMRGMLKMKKIGHTGTLDPDATGVLPVCLGNATKLCDMLTDTEKEYETVMLLGTKTDTQDITGTVLETKEVHTTEEELCKLIKNFIGNVLQVPPMYSALKVNGQKLCDLARAGKEVERKPREIVIHSIEVVSVELPEVRMRIRCSKGTYIRTLCQDIGEALGCGGCMKELVRTATSGFCLEQSLTLMQLQESIDSHTLLTHVIPIDSVFEKYVKGTVREEHRKAADNGNPLSIEKICFSCEVSEGQMVRVYASDGLFYGIFKVQDNICKPIKMFFSQPLKTR